MRGGKVSRSFTDQRFRRDKELLLFQVEMRELSFSRRCSAEYTRRMVITTTDATLGAFRGLRNHRCDGGEGSGPTNISNLEDLAK